MPTDARRAAACVLVRRQWWRRISRFDREHIMTQLCLLPRGTASDDGWLSLSR